MFIFMRRFLVLAGVLMISLQVIAQNNVTTEVIITDALREKNEVPFTEPALSWDDFKGRPERNVDWTAMTYSGIKLRYEYKVKNGNYTIKIQLYPYMDRTRSWYIEQGHNDHTLAHEQLHFDITILVTKQLAQELRNMEYNPKKFSRQIDDMHEEFLEKLRKMQDEYDEQTMHGVKVREQKMWDRKIETQMNQFADK